MDVLLSTGEQVSIALLAMALCERGIPARSFTGSQIRVRTTNIHRRARITEVETRRLRETIDAGIVPVVAGFQGIDDDGDITTIGRGGSDTSAVALAVALQADECQIYTDVDGVYTTDPRMVPEARRLDRISFEDCSSSTARAPACCISARGICRQIQHSTASAVIVPSRPRHADLQRGKPRGSSAHLRHRLQS